MPCVEPWRVITESVLRRFLIRRLRNAKRLQFGHRDQGSITRDFQRPVSTPMSVIRRDAVATRNLQFRVPTKWQNRGRLRNVYCLAVQDIRLRQGPTCAAAFLRSSLRAQFAARN